MYRYREASRRPLRAPERCRSTPQRRTFSLPRAPCHAAWRMSGMASLCVPRAGIRSQGVLLHVRFVGGMRACTCHAHARRSVSAHDGQLHRRTDWAGHSARKPPWIAAPHPHTPCACVSAKVGVACVQTGLCVPCLLCVPHAPHARSACTEPPIAHDGCGHWAVFSILIIYISMPGLIPVA